MNKPVLFIVVVLQKYQRIVVKQHGVSYLTIFKVIGSKFRGLKKYSFSGIPTFYSFMPFV